jgi:hypothetical protein
VANYTIINGTESQLVDVNAGGTDVDALTYKDGVALTNTEIATLLGTAGVAVLKDQTGLASAAQLKRVVATAGLYAST